MTTSRLAVLLLACAGCANGMNYSSSSGPRYAGGRTTAATAPRRSDAPFDVLRFVTFNVKYGVQIDSAIAVLRFTSELREADVVALQEVDAAGTARIAAALGLDYVYYPATLHPKFNRDFGNAILSRWPIVGDQKLILPHLGRFRRTARTATAATILVAGAPLRVYSAHLGTMAEIGPRAKRDQAATIIADAAAHTRVVILGDMNSYGIGSEFSDAGFSWVTARNPRTFAMGRWDHMFLKGVKLSHDSATGVVTATRDASDHRPVWALLAPPEP